MAYRAGKEDKRNIVNSVPLKSPSPDRANCNIIMATTSPTKI
jgi:hypothetical protein